MLDTNKKLISLDELEINNQEIKDYIKSQGIGMTPEEVQELIDASDKNTTYTLSKNENNEIVLTSSDGQSYTVSDSDTKTNNEVFSNTEPSSQNDGDVWTKLL